jgi:hypothetical protein
LINGYGPGHNPSIIDYGAFCGSAGLIIAVVGIAAIFFDALQGIIVLALDAFAAFFLLAGGLVSRPQSSRLVSTHRLTGICCHN